MGGIRVKLCSGGGDDVAHSSVHAFQGLSPASFGALGRWPLRYLETCGDLSGLARLGETPCRDSLEELDISWCKNNEASPVRAGPWETIVPWKWDWFDPDAG